MTTEILCHVINRGVDKRIIFQDDQDYCRFIYDLFIFNDSARMENVGSIFQRSGFHNDYLEKFKDPLVTLHAFCLMPNHYHLLMSAAQDNGISRFMQKVNAGYAKYFNTRYKRKGTLFESRYKSISIANEAHFVHIPYYIHCNPLDISFPQWRDRNLSEPIDAWKFLETYRWSSHLDYSGKANFPLVTNREFLLSFFGGENGYKETMRKWLADMKPE